MTDFPGPVAPIPPPPLPDEAIRWPFAANDSVAIVLTVLSIPLVALFLGMAIFMPAGTAGENFAEPIRVLGVASEFERRAHETMAFLPGPVRLALVGSPATARENAEREWERLVEEANRHPELAIDPDAVAIARDVVLAGWGDDEATARVRNASTRARDTLPPELRRATTSLLDAAPGRGSSGGGLFIALIAVQFILLALGLALALGWLLRGRRSVRFRDAPALKGFGLGRGLSVFLWSDALLFLYVFFLVVVMAIVPSLEGYLWNTITWGGIPGMILVSTLLLRPRGATLGDTWAVARGRRLLVPAVVAIFAIDQLFEMGVGWTTSAVGYTPPMHMYLDESMLFGDVMHLALAAIDLCIGAPIVEEVLFRGVLFTALRARLRAIPAALISGLIFSLSHGYDPSGTAAIAFSGFLYAMVYEHTRSLAPCMLVHAVSNGLVFVSLMTVRVSV